MSRGCHLPNLGQPRLLNPPLREQDSLIPRETYMNMKSILAGSVSLVALLGTTISTYAAADLAALYDAAKKEGSITIIASPRDWCNYGGAEDAFTAKYPGIAFNSINEEGGSADELEAIKANKGNTGPQAPDIIDVGLGFGPQAKADG